jgi:hypothetical protein
VAIARRAAAALLVLVALSGCATTRIAEYRNPEGQVRLCQPNVEALTMGWVISTEAVGNELQRLRQCKEDAERMGFVRTPAGQETEETKRMIREADEARAESVRKQ